MCLTQAKFGVKRERVKFVLVPDFVYVITRGEGVKSKKWGAFKDLCRQCYIIVRRNGGLLINLLNMMLSTGVCVGEGVRG
jgi:phosphatidylinositol-4,5-bisphosphate 3-kinase